MMSGLLSDIRMLQTRKLPSRLTAHCMCGVSGAVLQPGTLPTSLVALFMVYKDDVVRINNPFTAMQTIAPGVLLSQLQWLNIVWPRPLADLTLPPSLTRLHITFLSDLPIPPYSMPPHLHTQRIRTTQFNPHHLAGALPSSLRVL